MLLAHNLLILLQLPEKGTLLLINHRYLQVPLDLDAALFSSQR
jgi:hypothetical protein